MEQPVTRRTFFQFSLALACASRAEAGPAPSLRGLFEPRLQGDKLMVALRIHNNGEKPAEILARRGVARAIQVHASWGSWQAQSTPDPDTEMRTRAGPRLLWQPLPPQADWDAGTFEFVLPSGSSELLKQTAAFRATVQTHQGALVLQAEGVRVAAAP